LIGFENRAKVAFVFEARESADPNRSATRWLEPKSFRKDGAADARPPPR
jgi:hypothetical protein